MKKIFLIFISFFIYGCAQPKYVNENSTQQQSNNSTTADCSIQFVNSKICLNWKWEKLPTSENEGSLIFKTFNLNKYDNTMVLINPQNQPELILWMTSMGHGSTPTVIEQIDIGTYRASEVYFVMPGEWDFKFQIKNGATVTDEAIVRIHF